MAQSACNILFLCNQNARESLIAEAILRSVGGRRFRAHSAGVTAAPLPAPGVVEFLASRGMAGAFLRPKVWHAFTGPEAPAMDFVFSLRPPAAQLLASFPRAVSARWNVDHGSDLRDVFWTLSRRIKMLTALPARAAARQRMQDRMHTIAAWQ
jgi:protein-tyrosine-phosphatase